MHVLFRCATGGNAVNVPARSARFFGKISPQKNPAVARLSCIVFLSSYSFLLVLELNLVLITNRTNADPSQDLNVNVIGNPISCKPQISKAGTSPRPMIIMIRITAANAIALPVLNAPDWICLSDLITNSFIFSFLDFPRLTSGTCIPN